MANDIEAIKKERKVTRTLFTKNANVLENMFESWNQETSLTIMANYLKVKELQSQLIELDQQIRTLMRNDEDALETEMESATEYRSRWLLLQCKYEQISSNKNVTASNNEKRNFKLPKLQFIIFNGDLKGWLPFRGQFQKINSDPQIDVNDKYQYLLQAMAIGSEPRALVESFSHSSYDDCLNQLKARYAREELLIQVYVRELLSMINSNDNQNITTLFDKLSAQLRALETLGVTKDKFAAFLLPMVESALPQELLKIWERAKKENKNTSIELSDLLAFLRREVESEQRITLAKKFNEKVDIDTEIKPTAGCLLTETNAKKITLCIWCDKDSHSSLECFKLQKMSLEDRRAHLKTKKICAICLRRGHHPKFCKAFIKCVVCGQRHSVVLCTGEKQNIQPLNANLAANNEDTNTATSIANIKPTSTNISAGSKQRVGITLLQTVSVWIGTGQRQIMVRAMFDNGAQRSYIKDDLVRKLNIPAIGNEIISHSLFGVQIASKEYKLYDLNVTSLDKKNSFNLTAIGQTCICVNIPTYINNNINNLSHLLTRHNITLSDSYSHSDEIGLLIGADYSGFVLTGDVVKLQDSLFAVKTKLGWTLQGKIICSPNTINMQSAHLAMFCSADLSNFWSLETLGIRDPAETKTKQQNEEEVLANFEENVKVNSDGRYEVVLPWKVGHDELLNNHELASRRLNSVTKRLMITNMYEDYNKVFKEWRDLNIIEIVPNPNMDLETSHYLPHRPVIKEKSLTTRIRPVFDASAKDSYGKSLNLCLDKSVNMLDKIPKLLNGFRKRAIGITADITKAFLQVSLIKKDRDMLRFLWWDDDNKNKMITYRHYRVVFGLTCSPFLLSATIQHHLNGVIGDLKESADILASSFYVDNCQTSLDSEEAVKKFKTDATQIMGQAKFNLTQWAIAPALNLEKDAVISVLGLEWHVAEDQLSCNMNDLPTPDNLGKITKRNLLSITQRIYDPIGFTAAVTLIPKLILQETWRRKVDWDEEIPHDLKTKFINWYVCLPYLKKCRIPRRLTATLIDKSSLQLHMFCDACRDGYAACVFLRAADKGNISVRLVSTKSRVAPPEKLTIPRLELLAGLIGSRLLAEAKNDLKIECKEYCWIDSNVALYWIKRELPWNTYIGNRVKEIRQNTSGDNWFHIPGTSNWADLASRGCDAVQLFSSRWLEGPTWLHLSPAQWPKSLTIVDVDEAEATREPKKTTVCNVHSCPKIDIISRLSYFSKYSKTIRTAAWMLRFIYNARNKNKIKGELSYEEYKERQDGLEVGDIVLIEMDEKRIKWPLGLIEEIFTGRDDIKRTAKVKTSSGYKVRPFQRLYKLEVGDSDDKFVFKEKTTRSGRVTKLPSRYLI